MKKLLVAIAAVAAVAGCAYQPLRDMRGADVAAPDQAPAEKQYAQRAPNADMSALIPRTFKGQPPLIPHEVEKYLPITMEENDCLDCHISDDFKGRKMPRIGDSHFSKTEKEPDGSPKVNMSRWQCNSCHVPQVDAPPLVDNTFVGNK
ncbi:MAG TPA: nitrate reductase cytochrome c-type subunit [Rhodocyclaceae bacterium]